MANNNSNRIDYIDYAKALGMIAIMWGHIRLSGWSFIFVYSFDIPLFFFLSGLVFDRNRYSSFKVFLSRKVKTLLIPYLIYSLVFWIVWAGFSYGIHAEVQSYWMPLAQTFIAQGSSNFLVHNAPLWFVTCLFVLECVYYFISKLKRFWIIIMSMIIAAIGWYGISHEFMMDWKLLPWNIEVACLMIPVFAAGHLLAQTIGHARLQDIVNKNKIVSWGGILVTAVCLFFLSGYNGRVGFGHTEWGRSLFLAYVTGFIGTAMILIFCMLLAGLRSNATSHFLKGIKWFGGHSFDAMAIHNPIKGVVCMGLGLLLHISSSSVSETTLYSFVALMTTLTITVLGMIIASKVRKALKKHRITQC